LIRLSYVRFQQTLGLEWYFQFLNQARHLTMLLAVDLTERIDLLLSLCRGRYQALCLTKVRRKASGVSAHLRITFIGREAVARLNGLVGT
jgi:hypothetical protein